jgi:hypothetical protein
MPEHRRKDTDGLILPAYNFLPPWAPMQEVCEAPEKKYAINVLSFRLTLHHDSDALPNASSL